VSTYIRAHVDLYALNPFGSYGDGYGDIAYTIAERLNRQTLRAEYIMIDCQPMDSFSTACDPDALALLAINCGNSAVPYTPVPTGSLIIEIKPMLDGDLNVYFRP